MSSLQRSTATYPHPFSKAYWRDALQEGKSLKMLTFAALMIALRLIMKTYLAIPLAPSLKINTAFFINALGAMVFGPVLAGICAVVTDVLGYLMKPEGVYFVPFVLTEVAGSVTFALFLYRTKVTPVRVMLSRFCICFFVNVLLQTPIMLLYYQLYMGGKVYELTIPGIIKNLFMFPIESVVLTLFLSVMLPVTNRLGLTHGNADAKKTLSFTNKQIVLLVVLVCVGIGSVGGYLTYHYKTTSLSASYTPEERVNKNHEMQPMVLANEDSLKAEDTVTIVEKATKKFLGDEITYKVAVYQASAETDMDTAWGYSKSKAEGDGTMTLWGKVEIVVTEKTGEFVSYQIVPDGK